MEPEIRPAPQATRQAKPVDATIVAVPALLTPPPTPPTSSGQGSQDGGVLPGQNTNEEATETANPEATEVHSAEQGPSATGERDEPRRSADSAQPLSRVATAVESIRNTFQSQLKTQISVNEDGVRVWTCTLTLNKTVIFFIVHFVVVFAVSFAGLFLQVWSMIRPSPPGVSLEQMQQLLQTSANEASKRVLATFEDHVGDENVNWQSLIRVLKACLNYSGINVSSVTCETALQAFNKNSSSSSEILRKRAELTGTIQALSPHPPSASSLGSSEYDVGLIVALVLLYSLFKFLSKRRTLPSKNKEYDARDEKKII